MTAADLFIAFDNFVTFFPTSERKLLPVAYPFETYDELTFRERYTDGFRPPVRGAASPRGRVGKSKSISLLLHSQN